MVSHLSGPLAVAATRVSTPFTADAESVRPGRLAERNHRVSPHNLGPRFAGEQTLLVTRRRVGDHMVLGQVMSSGHRNPFHTYCECIGAECRIVRMMTNPRKSEWTVLDMSDQGANART